MLVVLCALAGIAVGIHPVTLIQAQEFLDVTISDATAVEASDELLLFVTVSGADPEDGAVRPLTELPAQAFRVQSGINDAALSEVGPFSLQTYEQYLAEQPASERRPLNLALLLDRSTSMAGEPIETSKASAIRFIESRPPGDQIALYSFGIDVTQHEGFTEDRARLREHIEALEADQESTALYEAIRRAANDLADRPRPHAIVLLTDGWDDVREWYGEEPPATMQQAASAADAARAPVYLLGFGNTVDEAASTIAEQTKGRYLARPGADEIDGLFADVGDFLNPYVIRFEQARPDDARRIEVRVEVAQGAAQGWDDERLTVEQQSSDEEDDEDDESSGLDALLSFLASYWIPLALVAIIAGSVVMLMRSRRPSNRSSRPPSSGPSPAPRSQGAARQVGDRQGSAGATKGESRRPTLPDAHADERPRQAGGPRAGVTIVKENEPKAPEPLAWLTITEGPAQQTSRPILAEDCKIGRDRDNDIIIADPTVSRQQARLRLTDGRWMVFNLSQTQTLWVNGEPGHGRELSSDDELRFGDTAAVFHLPRAT